jgi:hypothetical protein
MALTLIKINSEGANVEAWQNFLLGQKLYAGILNGLFDAATKTATIIFQKKNGLQPDGVVGNKTFGKAMQLGFGGVADDSIDKSGSNWPAKPAFDPLISNAERQAVFGQFSFVSKPLPDNPEHIRITDDWESRNIVTVAIPQLIGIKGTDRVRFHKSAGNQLVQLWADWEGAGLLNLVLTWGGSFVPRFVRGSRTILSNHAFGSAFDINVAWNLRGTVPALVGQKGAVRELVTIAHANGFYWGGHFSRQDGMHFEVAQL